ncbi:MAG TPA: cyclic peptide export ABC transporter [Aquabacterium sp.]|nr:cyclic peptide export ABC transporter [Aquabacterium sp.]
MKLLKYLFRHSPKLLLLAIVAGVLSGLSGAGLIGVITESIGAPGQDRRLAWAFVGLCLAYLVTKTGSEMALLQSTQGAIVELRTELSRKLLSTPHKKLQDVGKHGLFAILTKDVETFVQAFQLVPLVLGNVVVIGGCLVYLAWLSWQIVAVFTICLLAGIAAFQVAEQRPLKRMAEMREQMDVLYQDFRNLIEGAKELQLNARRGDLYVERVIRPSASRFRQLFVQSLVGYMAVTNVGTIMFYVIIGVLVFVVPMWMPQSGKVLATATVVLLYLIRPIIELVGALPLLRQAAISLGKIEQLDGELGTGEPAPAGRVRFAGRGPLCLELKGVCHEYPGANDDRRFMLGPVDLQVTQGEIVFIVGGNGSGKTTLAMLLLGFYAPEAGEIVLNGVAVTDENRAAYRQTFSAVFSDFHLFEQLLDAEDEGLRAKAAHYIDRLAMSHKVKVADNRFSTIKLSTGQRKRLAMVSSYLEDRPFYLFDEWAADQDPAFKRVFYTELLPDLKARGKTVLVITHDDAYFSCADRLVKVQDGRVSLMDRTDGPSAGPGAFARPPGGTCGPAPSRAAHDPADITPGI